MCKECLARPVYEFTNKKKLCKRCFIKWFEKKFLFILRKYKMLQKGDCVYVENKKDFKGRVLKKLLNIYAENGSIQIKNYKKGCNKIALSDTADSFSRSLVYHLINKKIDLKKFKPVEKKNTKPLFLFLDREVLLYAQLRNLEFKSVERRTNKTVLFVDELEKKHPELKHSIVNSILELD